MKLLCPAALLLALSPLSVLAQQTLPSFSDPSLSPDGTEILFSSGGDIWAVPSKGGVAHLMVPNRAPDPHPVYSPNGKQMAFVSTRTGNGDIYILSPATGELRRLTYSDAPDTLDSWSADGRWIYFTSPDHDPGRLGDIYRVSAEGGTPVEVSREEYLNEFESAPSPDGRTLALVTRGISSQQWWRNGHSHIDETEIWLKRMDAAEKDGGYRRLLAARAKHAWPMWSADGKRLFYMSDAGGAENLWSADVASGAERQLTHFTSGRLLFPSIGDHGKQIVFERDLGIWKVSTGGGKPEPVAITLRGAAQLPVVRHERLARFSHMALSPDAKKAAVIAHGEIFAASAKDGGEAMRVTETAAVESDTHWSPDSNRIAYVSQRNSRNQVFEYDFSTRKERQISPGLGEEERPVYSPDGKMLAYVRDDRELHLVMLEGLADRVLASDKLNDTALSWSPDSKWIAYSSFGPDAFRNISVVPLSGAAPQPVTFLANGETAYHIAWSPDGSFLLFETAQRSEPSQIGRVDLKPHAPKYREDEFTDLFKKSDGEKKPDSKQDEKAEDKQTRTDEKKTPPRVEIVFDGLRQRLTLLPLGVDASDPVISPDGKTLVFLAEVGGESNLYGYSLEELSKEPAVARQLTSTASSKSNFQFSPDSKEVYFLEDGQLHALNVESRTGKVAAITAVMDIDFDHERDAVFEQAWSELNRHFYDPKFHGKDWRALHDRFRPYADGSETPEQLRRNISLMIGELNTSHSGISGPPAAEAVNVGRLGLRFDRSAYESGKGLVIHDVVAQGPAAIEGSIHRGDTLLAVNGRALEPRTNLDALLEDTVGKRTVLSVRSEKGATRDAVVRPVSSAAQGQLIYRQWVEQRRAYVEKISGGKLGYVHMRDMGEASLRQLYIDLDAQNQTKRGVVVDIRNNNGGFVNGYALDVFARKNFLIMTPRGLPAVPSRQALGQRALGLPTVLVTNESSLSDAEDFTEGYRALHLGRVVGTPTAGWIIFTSGKQLIDGSVLRLPESRIEDTRGEEMEGHPRPVDVEVLREPGETGQGRDSQLDRAVAVLLGELPK